MTTIDEKINELLTLCDSFLIVEYYTHENCNMYKILNPFTYYREEKLVLCKVTEGIDKALDLAIKQITKCKKDFFGEGGTVI